MCSGKGEAMIRARFGKGITTLYCNRCGEAAVVVDFPVNLADR
jgi:hypothetical protein